MPAECSYCGERKLCRKEDQSFGVARGWEVEHITYEWICEECDKAKAIIRNEERLANIKKQKINQANWIKERDKILKQNDK